MDGFGHRKSRVMNKWLVDLYVRLGNAMAKQLSSETHLVLCRFWMTMKVRGGLYCGLRFLHALLMAAT